MLCLAVGDDGCLEAVEGAGGTGQGGARDDPFEDDVLSRVGGWKWIDGPVNVNVRNKGHRSYEAIVVEWLEEGQAVDGNSRL